MKKFSWWNPHNLSLIRQIVELPLIVSFRHRDLLFQTEHVRIFAVAFLVHYFHVIPILQIWNQINILFLKSILKIVKNLKIPIFVMIITVSITKFSNIERIWKKIFFILFSLKLFLVFMEIMVLTYVLVGRSTSYECKNEIQICLKIITACGKHWKSAICRIAHLYHKYWLHMQCIINIILA